LRYFVSSLCVFEPFGEAKGGAMAVIDELQRK
jgi:hypothetical protein